jgi:hypothetical protein
LNQRARWARTKADYNDATYETSPAARARRASAPRPRKHNTPQLTDDTHCSNFSAHLFRAKGRYDITALLDAQKIIVRRSCAANATAEIQFGIKETRGRGDSTAADLPGDWHPERYSLKTDIPPVSSIAIGAVGIIANLRACQL